MLGYYLLMVLSILLMFQSFFPIIKYEKINKVFPPETIDDVKLNTNVQYKSEYSKTVIIVIDALRADFVQLMPNLQKITKANGCLTNVTVESPTVTLPRIKALTSGSIPQFIDLVFNLIQSEILMDSIIHSAYESGKRIVFYGDDTWLKLFPHQFVRSEGTSSFFVKDFKEVDDNVTRNVDQEIYKDDWDIMILHYLGLDHIGHVEGPRSPLIPIKLKEMEDVILKIYNYLANLNQKSVILVTGDHGMKDSGGHGGSTFSEVNVPLIALGINCSGGAMLQTDISSNLAVLLGLRIPSTAVGQLKSHFLLSLTFEQYLLSLFYNTKILVQNNDCEMLFKNATDYHKLYIQKHTTEFAYTAINFYNNCTKFITDARASTSGSQNIPILWFSIVLMTCTMIKLLKNITILEPIIFYVYICVIGLFLSIFFISITSKMLHMFSLIYLIFLFQNMRKIKVKFNSIHLDDIIIHALVITHPISYFSSSYVEEEQQYWYFTSQFIILTCFCKMFRTGILKNNIFYLLLPIVLRFLITLNQTGDKWAHLPDLSDWFKLPKNLYYFISFYIFSLLFLYTCIIKLSRNIYTRLTCTMCIIMIVILKYQNNSNILLARFIWATIILNFYFDKKLVTWLLLCSLLFKEHNILLLPFFVFTSNLFSKCLHNNNINNIAHISLANALYFAQGHSNSLASVDISIGYIGLNYYEPSIVFFQVLCHTYAMPVLSHILLISRLKDKYYETWNHLLFNRLYINVAVCIITYFFKDHIFIWSVFTPKLFIEIISTLFIFVEMFLHKIYMLINKIT